MTIKILQRGPHEAGEQARLDREFTMLKAFDDAAVAQMVAEHGTEIRGIATRGEIGASAELMATLPNLEVVVVYGVGYDAVDVDHARANNIRVTNTPDVLTEDVADLAIGMMIAQTRAIIGADAWVRAGKWPTESAYPLQKRVHGRRAGVLGLGRIGREVATRCEAFNMPISYYSRTAKPDAKADWTYFDSPAALAADVDFLFVTLAANAGTHNIVDADVVAALGSEGTIINVSRGHNIDETALLAALEDGTLGAAALDVFDNEPTIDPRFMALPNVLLQPHQGSATGDTRRAMGTLMIDNLVAQFAGKPLLTAVV